MDVCCKSTVALAITALMLVVTEQVLGAPGLNVVLEASEPPLLGDPVLIAVRVRNNSGEPRAVVAPLVGAPWSTTVGIELQAPTNDALQKVSFPAIYAGPFKSMPAAGTAPIVSIPAHGERSWDLLLDYDFHPSNKQERRFLFPVPGMYRIQVKVYMPAGPVSATQTVDPSAVRYDVVESPELAFEVRNRTRPEDRAAFKTVLGSESGWLLYGPEWVGSSMPDDLSQLVLQHPESEFAEYAKLLLVSRDFHQAVAQRSKMAVKRVVDRCIQLQVDAKRSGWPKAWRTKADLLAHHIVRQYETVAPSLIGD